MQKFIKFIHLLSKIYVKLRHEGFIFLFLIHSQKYFAFEMFESVTSVFPGGIRVNIRHGPFREVLLPSVKNTFGFVERVNLELKWLGRWSTKVQRDMKHTLIKIPSKKI